MDNILASNSSRFCMGRWTRAAVGGSSIVVLCDSCGSPNGRRERIWIIYICVALSITRLVFQTGKWDQLGSYRTFHPPFLHHLLGYWRVRKTRWYYKFAVGEIFTIFSTEKHRLCKISRNFFYLWPFTRLNKYCDVEVLFDFLRIWKWLQWNNFVVCYLLPGIMNSAHTSVNVRQSPTLDRNKQNNPQDLEVKFVHFFPQNFNNRKSVYFGG